MTIDKDDRRSLFCWRFPRQRTAGGGFGVGSESGLSQVEAVKDSS